MNNFLIKYWQSLSLISKIRFLFYIFFLITFLLFLKYCYDAKKLKEKYKQELENNLRLTNNQTANKTLINYKINDSINRSIIQAYQLTQKELLKNYKNLLNEFNDLKKKTAFALIKGTTTIKETLYIKPIIYTIDKLDSLSLLSILSGDTVIKYSSEDSLKFKFKILLKSEYYKKDDSILINPSTLPYFHKFYIQNSQFTFQQTIGLKVGLFQDKKDKKIYIYAQSKYPNLIFSKLEGADILSDENSKILLNKTFRKPYGISLQLGYGINFIPTNNTFTIYKFPYIGIGIHYSPKFLQWGR